MALHQVRPRILGFISEDVSAWLVASLVLLAGTCLTGVLSWAMMNLINQQLRQVDKLKDQFLANTSHELRTPLNGIVGLSESLLENSHTEQEKEDLELIISSGRRLSNLVNDILDFSRLKEHDLQLNLKPVDIRTIADLCLRLNRSLIQDKKLTFLNQIPSTISYCLADENRLQQILQNLVANAVEAFAGQDGRVRVLARRHDIDHVLFVVLDSGPGVDAAVRDRLFEPFSSAKAGGLGLGLAVSRTMAEANGGSLEARPGRHGEFHLILPCRKS